MRDPLESITLVTRRDALRRMAIATAALTASGCRQLGASGTGAISAEGRLSARPHPPSKPAPTGLTSLGLDSARDALLYVPKSYRAEVPAPLVVLLHGAGQEANELMRPMQPFADEMGLILAAPNSRDASWDVRYGGFGPDVEFIDKMLGRVFDEVRVATNSVSLCGFSDGASYALSLGRVNGDLFGHILAFSPGFMVTPQSVGKPKIFITHGTLDRILSIDRTSRVLVPQLKKAGYDVEYREFEGPHTVPRALLRDAVTWLTT